MNKYFFASTIKFFPLTIDLYNYETSLDKFNFEIFSLLQLYNKISYSKGMNLVGYITFIEANNIIYVSPSNFFKKMWSLLREIKFSNATDNNISVQLLSKK